MKILSSIVPIFLDNIDTDQIIPAEYLKSTSKVGFGNHLFKNWRYLEDGVLNPNFELNLLKYKDAKILLAGNNFGCGSSREHAAWALADYGFMCVLSSGFADIFRTNALNNQILPIELSKEEIDFLHDSIQVNSTIMFTVDLKAQLISSEEISFRKHFSIDAFKKECILTGLDETTYLIKMRSQIEEYETKKDNK